MFRVDLATIDRARFVAGLPELAGNGHVVDVDGRFILISRAALGVLAELPGDVDGHYDGVYVWVGGAEYAVEVAG